MSDRHECGVCWHVYDPAEGDTVAQIPPGTAFAALPEDWRCPHCEAPKARFLALEPASADAAMPRVAALLAAYRAAERAMRGLPVHNPALAVEAIGFRRLGEGIAGIVVTPWFMNLTLLPDEPNAWDGPVDGATEERILPAGAMDFTVATLPGFGRILTCSLFSPMDVFAAMDAARLAAEGAMEAVMTVPAPAAPPAPRALGRRGLFAAAAE
jgi:[NiFe] hydrogenase assembly HybE family chaperone